MPDSFEGLEGAIRKAYDGLVADGTIQPREEVAAPAVPMDLEAAKKAGKVKSRLGLAIHLSTSCLGCAHGLQAARNAGKLTDRPC